MYLRPLIVHRERLRVRTIFHSSLILFEIVFESQDLDSNEPIFGGKKGVFQINSGTSWQLIIYTKSGTIFSKRNHLILAFKFAFFVSMAQDSF